MRSVWVLLALVLAIFIFELISNGWNSTVLLALLVLTVLGAIFPPFGITFAGLVLLYLILARGNTVITKLTPRRTR